MTASNEEQPQQSLTVTGRFYPPSTIPTTINHGQWAPYTWNNNGVPQDGARLTPQRAPWRDLFAALDASASRFSDEPVTWHQEVDAIVACCWLHGSYTRVLASGEPYPPFKHDRDLSRLSDPEMMRINLEFSSGLAMWLSERADDPAKINRRVRAACDVLAMPWRGGDVVGTVETDYPARWCSLYDPSYGGRYHYLRCARRPIRSWPSSIVTARSKATTRVPTTWAQRSQGSCASTRRISGGWAGVW
jgi:hypothetical protein